MCLGIPGKITEIYDSGAMKMCKIDFGGVVREVCIQALPDAQIGDWTIVHAGFALNILSEEEAAETLEALNEISMIEQELKLES